MRDMSERAKIYETNIYLLIASLLIMGGFGVCLAEPEPAPISLYLGLLGIAMFGLPALFDALELIDRKKED